MVITSGKTPSAPFARDSVEEEGGFRPLIRVWSGAAERELNRRGCNKRDEGKMNKKDGGGRSEQERNINNERDRQKRRCVQPRYWQINNRRRRRRRRQRDKRTTVCSINNDCKLQTRKLFGPPDGLAFRWRASRYEDRKNFGFFDPLPLVRIYI